MPQTLRGDVIRNDNIAVGWVCGAENAVARGVPGPTPMNETVQLVPGNYAQQVLADGASNYWRLNELSGLTAVDQIGGANGTISGGVTLNQPGALADGDTAMTFDGTTGKIVTAGNLVVVNPLTIECWMKSTVEGGLPSWNFTAFPVGATDCPSLSTATAGNNGFRCHVVHGPGDTARTELGCWRAGVSLRDGQWHHLVVVFSGTVVSGYIDGAFAGSIALYRALNVSEYRFQVDGPGAIGSLPTGSLDEVAIYPVALTAAQIAAHYALRNSGPVSPYGVEKIAVGVTGPNPEVP